MRQLSLFLLLATAAVPALAASDDDRDGRRHRSQSSEQSEGRGQRAAESGRAEGSEQRAVRAQRSEPSQAGQQSSMKRMREHYRQQREERAQAVSTPTTGNQPGSILRRGDRDAAASGSGTALRPRERHVRTIPDTQPAATTQERGGIARAFEGRPRRDYRDGNYTRWSSSRWRHDHRYDWRRYRDRHRSLFRLGFYYDPFGWSYRRWSIGSYLYPGYYGSRYWLSDPWHYRLPPAYGPYRWVRYWDDALLVNIYTGTVVDVIHNFFW